MTRSVEFTADGVLRMPAELAADYFPSDALVARLDGERLWLIPLTGPAGGGLYLKQRNPRGDRSTLIWEVFAGETPVGSRPVCWDPERGALRVELS